MSELVALPTLIFPTYAAKINSTHDGLQIFDDVRRTYVSLTPEEWVRQHCIHWLAGLGYPLGRCSVERRIDKTGMRYDVLWVDAQLRPFLLVECKAPSIRVSFDTLRQTAWYNITLKAPYILLTNGLHAFCALVETDGRVDSIPDVPTYPVIK